MGEGGDGALPGPRSDWLGERAVGAHAVALDEALLRLRDFNAPGAEVVEYRYFGGLQYGEIAEVLGVSEVTVRRRWTAARAWLKGELAASAGLPAQLLAT